MKKSQQPTIQYNEDLSQYYSSQSSGQWVQPCVQNNNYAIISQPNDNRQNLSTKTVTTMRRGKVVPALEIITKKERTWRNRKTPASHFLQ